MMLDKQYTNLLICGTTTSADNHSSRTSFSHSHDSTNDVGHLSEIDEIVDAKRAA
jgi:hypothetical protein